MAARKDRIDHLVGEEKTLLQTWCMRGAPFYFPTVDAPVFTAGVLPATQQARLHLMALTVTTFRSLGTKLREQLREDADHVARLHGASTVRVEFARL